MQINAVLGSFRRKRQFLLILLILLAAFFLLLSWEPFRRKVLPWRLYEGYNRTFEEGSLLNKRFAIMSEGEEVSFFVGEVTIRGQFYSSGKATPSRGLLLLHGGHYKGSNMAVYRLLARSLSRNGFSVLAPSLAGFGTSDPLPAPFTPNTISGFPYAKAALKYLAGRKSVDPNRIYVLGHSLGGSLALALGAGKTPIPIRGIISIGPLRNMEKRFKDPEEREAFRLRLMRDRRICMGIDAEKTRKVVELLVPMTYIPFYQKAGHPPLLLVDGEKDLEEEKEYLRTFFETIAPPKKYINMKNTGHYLGIMGLNRSHTMLLFDAGILDSLIEGIRTFCAYSEG